MISNMNKITQYQVSCFNDFEPEVSEFETLEQLLAIPWVASLTELDGFQRFTTWNGHLMVDYDDGDGEGQPKRIVGILEDAPSVHQQLRKKYSKEEGQDVE